MGRHVQVSILRYRYDNLIEAKGIIKVIGSRQPQQRQRGVERTPSTLSLQQLNTVARKVVRDRNAKSLDHREQPVMFTTSTHSVTMMATLDEMRENRIQIEDM